MDTIIAFVKGFSFLQAAIVAAIAFGLAFINKASYG